MTSIFSFILFLFGIVFYGQKTHYLSVYFDTDVYYLNTKENNKLDSIMQLLPIDDIYEIKIVGYCDDRASEAHNLKLSYNRANNIKSFFDVKLRIKHIDILVTGKGEIPLENKINVDTQRKINRRVDIEIKTLPNNNINRIKFAQVGENIILNNLLFVSNRHKIMNESLATLDSLVIFLKENKNIHFKILGHICCRKKGSTDAINEDTGKYNLSESRAKVVFEYLRDNGIATERMSYKGMKADFPLGKGDQFDRRVEFLILKK